MEGAEVHPIRSVCVCVCRYSAGFHGLTMIRSRYTQTFSTMILGTPRTAISDFGDFAETNPDLSDHDNLAYLMFNFEKECKTSVSGENYAVFWIVCG